MLNKAPIYCDCTKTVCNFDSDCIIRYGSKTKRVYDCRSGIECSRTFSKCGCDY